MVRKKQKPEDADIVPEEGDASYDDESADLDEHAAHAVAALRKKLATCQSERQEYLDAWQRLRADHLNSKRRHEHEQQEQEARAKAALIEQLLPLCDTLQSAVQSLAEATDTQTGWQAGLVQTRNQLDGILRTYGAVAIDPAGEPFDPHVHEAVSEQAVTDARDDHVVQEVLQVGYRLGERLIRPAKVVVGTYTDTQDAR